MLKIVVKIDEEVVSFDDLFSRYKDGTSVRNIRDLKDFLSSIKKDLACKQEHESVLTVHLNVQDGKIVALKMSFTPCCDSQANKFVKLGIFNS